MSIQVCRDNSDAVALYLPQRLYLKPVAKINISVQLPSLKVHGKSLSNWELMEKFRKMIQPEVFSMLKVSKHTTEVIRFDAELERREKLEGVVLRINDRVVQLNDYPDALRVRASEAKSEFPNRYTWDSFFRDAPDMDEMKPGERPDTIHISNLPIRWFVNHRDKDENAPPSESIFKKVFEKFGSVRQVDVPVSDPYRMQMKATIRGITTPAPEQALYFEGYIQYNDYSAFVRCMDALRGRKLLKKGDEMSEWCSIRVDFDKTKHMTDAAVKRRAIVREKLANRQKAKDDEERKEKEKIARREERERLKLQKSEQEKLLKMKEREDRRKKKELAKLMTRDGVDMGSMVAEHERKLLMVQRRLQAIRLLEELFHRLECRNSRGIRDLSAMQRARLVQSLRRKQEAELAQQRERLQKALDGRVAIRSLLEINKPRARSPSVSSISSEENHRIKQEPLHPVDKEMNMYRAGGFMGGAPFPYPPYPVYYAHHPGISRN